jgi:hypothetical protein
MGGSGNWRSQREGGSYGGQGTTGEYGYGSQGSSGEGFGGQSYGGGQNYGGGQGYGSGQNYSSGNYGRQSYGGRGYDSQGSSGYGSQSPGGDFGWRGGESQGSDFGRRDFRPQESSPYYGTGNYSSGGSGLGGGYRGMQGMGAYGPSGGQYNAEYGNQPEGSYMSSGSRDRDWRGEDREQKRGSWLGRFFGRGPKGYKRSDERIREDISERLMHSGEVDSSDVTIEVADGTVTLTGTVPERHMKHAIEDLADSCSGVKDVDNKVRVQRRGSEWDETGSTSSAGTSSGVSGSTGGTASGTTTGSTSTGSSSSRSKTN